MTAEKATARRDDATMVRTLSRLRDVGRTVSSPDEDIRGRLVRDEGGRNLGRIKGLLIDDVAREIRFMEVASGGFLGLGERTSFISVSAITRVTDTDVSISRTGALAAGASRYDPDVVAVDPDYAENMYPYIGDPGYLGLFPVTRGYPQAMRRKARPKRSDG
jgi:PRC-barrel domain